MNLRRNLLIPFVSIVAMSVLLGCPKRVGSQSGDGGDPVLVQQIEEAKRRAEAGDQQGAHEILEQVGRQDDPAAADALFTLAHDKYAAKDFAGARTDYRALLERFPLYPQADTARLELGLAQLELKENGDALQTLGSVYPRLPPEQKPALAARLAQLADEAQEWSESLRWYAELVTFARDEQSQEAARQKVFALVDGKVSFTDVAKLAEQTPTSSPLWALLQYKLARVYAHLRDDDRLKETLDGLLENAPDSPFAPEARRMLERLARGEVVKPKVVGVVLPLSGKYKAIGESALAGLKLALGEQVQLVTRDTAGDVAQARKAVDELVQDEQVIAIIGPVLTNESEDAATEAELLETPIITLTRAEGITERGTYVFRNMLTNSAQAKAVVDYAMRVKGHKTFGVLYPNIAYGTELANFFWDEVENRDGEIRAAESYDHDQTTFGATAKKLVGRYYLEQREDYRAKRAEIRNSTSDEFRQRKMLEDLRKKLPPIVDFEALFIPDYYKNVGLVAPALAVEDIITNACDKRDIERIAKTTGKDGAHQIKTVQLFGGNGWNFDELVERGGKFVQCAIFVDGFFANSDRKETRAFVEAFNKAQGRTPVLLEAVAYDTGRIVRQIVERDQPQNRAAFRDALLRVKDFPGATGKTTINAQREAEKPLFFLTIDRGQIRELDSETKS